ncbi:MAG: LysR family transcriptional regulator [Spirochaetales bacterium]|jgi:molybdate transport system regulatory protein|nr:LysR family transcriptional regulator [Spirochaetales bacterium]
MNQIPETGETRVLAKVFLLSPEKNKPFCGPGMIKLLQAIEKTGSVRQACEEMEMSYSKGWKLLRGLEAWLGMAITVRHQGGKGGGEALLTQEGRDFLKKHLSFEKDCQQAVENLFEQYYGSPEKENQEPIGSAP